MVQTSNGVYNNTLLELITPNSLLAWQRVRITNAMATSGPEWSSIFAREKSGTYVNMYMVVDYKLFTPGQDLPDNLFWVVEEIPGLVEGSDETALLREGYFASYNRPFHQRVFNESGYPAMVAKYGNDFSYELCPRAMIFRRDNPTAVNLESFKLLMRSNDYRSDPFSHGDPNHAICSRGDLASPPSAGGCYDNKSTNSTLFKSLVADIINGPTTAAGTLPVFKWAGSGLENTPHLGLPLAFNFSYITVAPYNF
jgi:hypothetical protein